MKSATQILANPSHRSFDDAMLRGWRLLFRTVENSINFEIQYIFMHLFSKLLNRMAELGTPTWPYMFKLLHAIRNPLMMLQQLKAKGCFFDPNTR